MSSIDKYLHKHLGFIDCPTNHELVHGNPTKRIALYELLEDIDSDEKDFDGKTGDILIGGGSGEAPAFRISIPNCLEFFTNDEWDDFTSYDDLFKAFWTPTESFILCEGFLKLGWTPKSNIEFWLAENICSLLIENIEKYAEYRPEETTNCSLSFYSSV